MGASRGQDRTLSRSAPDPPDTLLDFPAHLNAGDALIYRGELEYARILGVRIGYVRALHTHDDELLARRCPRGPLLLHGGGNWGDRYDRHQLFRERMVQRHPDRTIVALPQSMDYSTDTALQRTQSVYAKHPDLHLLARDDRTYRRARGAFPRNHVHFCPDMAFGVGELSPSAGTAHEVVVLKRTDGESVHHASAVPDELRTHSVMTDWTSRLRRVAGWQAQTHLQSAVHRIGVLRASTYPAQRWAFERQSRATVADAVATISQGRVVVTDRLHAAVFGALLGKPVVMIDNATKKLSAAHESYLGSFPDVRLAEGFTQATTIVGDLLRAA